MAPSKISLTKKSLSPFSLHRPPWSIQSPSPPPLQIEHGRNRSQQGEASTSTRILEVENDHGVFNPKSGNINSVEDNISTILRAVENVPTLSTEAKENIRKALNLPQFLHLAGKLWGQHAEDISYIQFPEVEELAREETDEKTIISPTARMQHGLEHGRVPGRVTHGQVAKLDEEDVLAREGEETKTDGDINLEEIEQIKSKFDFPHFLQVAERVLGQETLDSIEDINELQFQWENEFECEGDGKATKVSLKPISQRVPTPFQHQEKRNSPRCEATSIGEEGPAVSSTYLPEEKHAKEEKGESPVKEPWEEVNGCGPAVVSQNGTHSEIMGVGPPTNLNFEKELPHSRKVENKGMQNSNLVDYSCLGRPLTPCEGLESLKFQKETHKPHVVDSFNNDDKRGPNMDLESAWMTKQKEKDEKVRESDKETTPIQKIMEHGEEIMGASPKVEKDKGKVNWERDKMGTTMVSSSTMGPTHAEKIQKEKDYEGNEANVQGNETADDKKDCLEDFVNELVCSGPKQQVDDEKNFLQGLHSLNTPTPWIIRQLRKNKGTLIPPRRAIRGEIKHTSQTANSIPPARPATPKKEIIVDEFHTASRTKLHFVQPENQNGITIVKPTKEILEAGSQRWRATAIGHFIGKKPYFHKLNSFVHSKWKGIKKVIAAENDSFLFVFNNEANLESVIEGGPHFFNGQPILLQRWRPGMSMERPRHQQIPVWIKLRNLPLEYWTFDGLSVVASGVGQPLYPDNFTSSCTRVAFARVCVLIDTAAHLPKTILVIKPAVEGCMSGTCKVDVEYEWLPPKCSNCSTLGHVTNACPKISRSMRPTGSAIKVYIPKVPKSIKSNGAGNIGDKKKKVEPENALERETKHPRPNTYSVWVPKKSPGTGPGAIHAPKPSSNAEPSSNLSPMEEERQISLLNPKGTRPTTRPCSQPCSSRDKIPNGENCNDQPRGTRPRTRPCSRPCSLRVQIQERGKEIALFNPFDVLSANED